MIISVLIFCNVVMAEGINKFNSIDIQTSPLLGQEMKTIEAKFGAAKFVKGISRFNEKIFTREEWNKFAWELHDAGHYLYRFERNNNEVQYRVLYSFDTSKSKFHPTKRLLRLWINFDKPPTINELSILIPEIKPFDDQNVRVFIENNSYSRETKLLYVANPSALAGLIANGYKGNVDGWGFSIEIVLEEKNFNPNELSKVEEVYICVSGIKYLGINEDYPQPYKFIKLSK